MPETRKALTTCPVLITRPSKPGGEDCTSVCGAPVQATCREETYFNVEGDGTLTQVGDSEGGEWTFYCENDHNLDGLVDGSLYRKER